VCTTDDFTRGVDALVYAIDEANDDMRIAYPLDLFDRNITDGRMMIVSFLTLCIGNNQGMGDIEHAKMYDSHRPRVSLRFQRRDIRCDVVDVGIAERRGHRLHRRIVLSARLVGGQCRFDVRLILTGQGWIRRRCADTIRAVAAGASCR